MELTTAVLQAGHAEQQASRALCHRVDGTETWHMTKSRTLAAGSRETRLAFHPDTMARRTCISEDGCGHQDDAPATQRMAVSLRSLSPSRFMVVRILVVELHG